MMNPDLKRIIDGITELSKGSYQNEKVDEFINDIRGRMTGKGEEKFARYYTGPVDRLAYGYMRKIAGSRVNIDDARQASNDFFLKIKTYKPEPTALKAWIWKALTDACKNILEKNYKLTFIGIKGQKTRLEKSLKENSGDSDKAKVISTMIEMVNEDLPFDNYEELERRIGSNYKSIFEKVIQEVFERRPHIISLDDKETEEARGLEIPDFHTPETHLDEREAKRQLIGFYKDAVEEMRKGQQKMVASTMIEMVEDGWEHDDYDELSKRTGKEKERLHTLKYRIEKAFNSLINKEKVKDFFK